MPILPRLALTAIAFAAACVDPVVAAEPLVVEAKIPLGDVSGRIDHLAYDAGRGRLLVAELGNGSVAIVDLDRATVVHRIAGLKEPQGVGYVAETDKLYVASAGDGLVRIYNAGDFADAGRIELKDDADNVRVDRAARQVLVGYGTGGLAVIDAAAGSVLATFPLAVHPEGFQLDPGGNRVFLNLADKGEVAVLDRRTGAIAMRWHVTGLGANFPMAIDAAGERVFAVFRRPAHLVAFAAESGAVAADVQVCGDADDVFHDTARHRLYVSCGDGHVDVLEQKQDAYSRIAQVATSAGARTSLFVPERDRLFVAARATGGAPAAIWILKPMP